MRKILIFMLLMTGLIPVFGSSSAHFYAERTSDTPDGAGYIYVYRGGGDNKTPNDKLTMPGSSDWKSSDSKFDAGEIEITEDSPADGYKFIDNNNSGTSNTTIAALHMYFFAKANAGYQFDGWYDKDGNLAEGSTLHYPYPGKKYTGTSSNAPASPGQGSTKDYTSYISRWNNGTAGSTPPYSGIYNNEINYLRYVLLISQQNGNSGADITMYAKFSIIPRHFKFVGTGFKDVSYTAAGTTVGDTTIESGNITSNIALSLAYDATKYNFAGWQWSIGQNGARTDISSSASASYTFVANRGYSGDIVWIWPILTEKADAVATVKVGSADAVPYETWAEAFAAAKAVEGEDEVIVTLKKDVEGIDAIQEVTRDMTLDLNGHTITGSVNNMFTIKGSGTDFTLCDNTPSDAGRIVLNISGETTYALAVQSGAKLILQSGGVSATNTNEAGTSRGVEIQSGATLEMIGGTVYAQSAKNAYALINRGAATIGGGVLQTRAKGTSTKGTGVTCVAFLNNGTATINNGNFIANADSTTAYGIQHNVNNTMTVNNAIVNATTGKSGAYGLYRSNGKIVVNDIKVKATYSVNVANKEQVKLFGGVYKTFNNLRQCAATDHDCYELESGVDYTNGYRFVVKGLADNPNVCKLLTLSSTTYYTSLADALVEVAAHPLETQKIIMTAFEHTLPAGNYTIPAASALVVPYDAGQVDVQIAPVDVQSWASLSQYHLLTLAPGANITVNGSLAVGGQQFGTSSSNPGPGSVLGAYAVLDMSAGGHITIANGANLYAYGFIKGAGDQSASGTILIQSGGTVYENLVINDLHGGGGTAACVNGTSASNSYDLFPFSQYFIQNVEPKMTIEYGAHERAFYDIQSSQGGQQGSVNVIGNTSDYLFQLSAGASATKWYDATRDYQCYEVRGSMTMNGITVTAADNMSMSSNKFILPVNNNMSITVKEDAVLDLPYSIKFQPGSELIIEEGAIVDTHKELYFYDYQDWDKYACGYAQTFGTATSGKNIPWHTLRDVSSAEALGHATLVVNGQLRIKDNGALYTSSHGGNITSTGSGKIIFNVAGKSANKNLYECWSTYGKREDGNALAQGETNKAAGQVQVGSFNLLKTWYIFGTPVECNPAKLRNSNDTYISTSGAVAGDIYQYCDGTWTKGGCITYHTIVWKNADGSVLETDENVPYGATPEYNGATPVKTGEEQAYSFVGWTPEVTTVNGDAEYTATYTPREYTITWKNADNALLATTMSHWGETPVYPTANPTPTHTDSEHHIYRFVGWTPEVHAVNSDVNVYTATYEIVGNLEVPGEHTVSIETTITTTKVHVTGHLVVTSNLKTDDLILEGTLNTSGEIENNGTVTATNVYYDLSNGTEGFKARTWYAIAVPWQVDVPAYNQAGCGVYLTNDGENFTQQNLGASFDLLYYDGAYRAQNGPSSKCWKLVEKDAAANQIIFPGRAYMIYLTSDAKTIRFKKRAGADLFITATQVHPYAQQTGNVKDANWNGIANPATFHAYLNTASGNQGQIYIAGEDRYEAITNMNTNPLVVGQPVFVQATDEKTVVAYATNENYASHAPRRMSSSNEEKIMAEVRIAPEGKAYTDRLYVGVEEVKADEYEIGKDLAKAGVSTKVAQMWVNRYNAQLCINSMALVNNRAEYPLTISAPAAGEYTIGMEPSAMAENQTYVLYLTFNGQPIWNLNYNAYTATLEKGTTEGYGLRLVYNAPEIATGIEETTILNGEQVRKVMIDEKVYIIRGGQVYSIDGQLVKY